MAETRASARTQPCSSAFPLSGPAPRGRCPARPCPAPGGAVPRLLSGPQDGGGGGCWGGRSASLPSRVPGRPRVPPPAPARPALRVGPREGLFCSPLLSSSRLLCVRFLFPYRMLALPSWSVGGTPADVFGRFFFFFFHFWSSQARHQSRAAVETGAIAAAVLDP